MQPILKNINYGTISAGGDVHIGDTIYLIERDFPHCILFLRIEKAGEDYQAMLSVKGPDKASVPLLRQKVSLPVESTLFEQVDEFQERRRGGEVMRLDDFFLNSSQTHEQSIQTAIYQSFLAAEIGQVCNDFLSLLQTGKIRDLLLVISTEEEVMQNLPWEMVLPLLTIGKSAALPRDNFGIVRSREKTVDAFNRQGPIAGSAPIKLLFIPALPENLSEQAKMLQIEAEQKKIIDAVRRLEATGNDQPKLVMEILDCADLAEIKAALASRSHDIVHISGHGQFIKAAKKGILVMENEDGSQQEVTGYGLGLALRSFSSIKLLVLSACETAVGGSEGSTAEQMAAVGIPAVLAMRFAVTDAGAQLFTEKLYERLAYGDTLTKAMHDARLELWQEVQQRRVNAPQVDIPAEWFTPVLYQNQIIGSMIKPKQYNVDTLNRFYPKPDFLRRKDTRLIGEGFIGRKRLLIQLRHHLRQGRHVCLHGLGGLGKTTTAEAFAHHYRQRYGYEVLLFSRGSNIQEAVILEKIFSRWKTRTQPAEDVAAELKALVDNPNIEPEKKLQLLLDNCLTGRQTILILDNFEDVQTDVEGAQQQSIVSETLGVFIRYLLQNSPSDCHVLFTSRYAISGLGGLVTHLELDKLSYAEQYRYLNFSPTLRRIPLNDRDLLHRRFDGHPRAFQFLEGLLTQTPETDLNSLIQKATEQIFEDLLLERIYSKLTEVEREIFTVASVFLNRNMQAALSAVLQINLADLTPILSVLREWSLCFWDETSQIFEVHALTREWMRQQKQPEWDRYKTLSQQIGSYYKELFTWTDFLQAKDYFEQAEDWEAYAQMAYVLESYYRLIGLYPLAHELNTQLLAKNISPKANAYGHSGLGVIHLSLGQFKQALYHYQHCLIIAQQNGLRQNEGDTLNNFGNFYNLQGQNEEALNYYQQALVIAQQVGDRIGECKRLSNIGMIYSRLGQYEQALTYLQRSLAINKQENLPQSDSAALNNIGEIYTLQGRYDQALNSFQQSLDIIRKIGDRGNEGTVLSNISAIYSHQGQYKQALAYLQQSLVIVQEIGDRNSESTVLSNISIIYSHQGQYKQALTYLQQSLAIAQQIGNRSTEGTILSNLGDFYNHQEQYEQAVNYYQQSIDIAQQIADRNKEETLLTKISKIGLTVYHKGQFEQALSCFQQSLLIAQHIGDRSKEEMQLSSIGETYYRLGQYEHALSYFLQALTIAQQDGQWESEGVRLNNIANTYGRLGQNEEALSYYHQSLAINQRMGNLRGESSVLNNIGNTYLQQRQYAQALNYFEQNMPIAQKIGDQNGEATSVAGLGIIYWIEYQDVEKAISLLTRSYQLFTKIGSPNADIPESYLKGIIEQIGEKRFAQIIQSNQANSKS